MFDGVGPDSDQRRRRGDRRAIQRVGTQTAAVVLACRQIARAVQHQPVIARAAVNRIGAGAAGQHVIAAAAGQIVIAGRTIDGAAAGAAGKGHGVVANPARDIIGREALIVQCQGVTRRR